MSKIDTKIDIRKFVSKQILSEQEQLLNEGLKELAAAVMFLGGSIFSQAQVNKLKTKKEFMDVVKSSLEDSTIVNQLAKYGVTNNNLDIAEKNLAKFKDFQDIKTVNKTTSSESELKALLKRGYSLTSVDVDTIVSLKDELGDPVEYDQYVIDLSQDFLTAKYDLLSGNKIKHFLDSIKDSGALVDVYIESSTDKEPIKMTNEQLSSLRNLSIKDFLTSQGVSDTIISSCSLPNQGPDLYSGNISSEERAENRKTTQPYRYVRAIFTVAPNIEDVQVPSEETEEIKTKYSLVKAFSGKKSKTPPHKKRVNPKKFKNNYKVDACPKWLDNEMIK